MSGYAVHSFIQVPCIPHHKNSNFVASNLTQTRKKQQLYRILLFGSPTAHAVWLELSPLEVNTFFVLTLCVCKVHCTWISDAASTGTENRMEEDEELSPERMWHSTLSPPGWVTNKLGETGFKATLNKNFFLAKIQRNIKAYFILKICSTSVK